jgi:hypothetical protein
VQGSIWQPPSYRTVSQLPTEGAADSVKGLSGNLVQKLQQVMDAAKRGSEAAKLAHVAACKAAGQFQASTSHAVVDRAGAVAASGRGEQMPEQQGREGAVYAAGTASLAALTTHPAAAAAASHTAEQLAVVQACGGGVVTAGWQPSLTAASVASDDSRRCSSSLSVPSHYTAHSQGRLSAMEISSAGSNSCSSTSSYASAEPDAESAAAAAADKEHADMQLPASVLEELLSATAELDSGDHTAGPAAGIASAAAAARCARSASDLAAAAEAAMVAFGTDAEHAAAPEARQQRPPAPAPHISNRAPTCSSTYSTTLCSSLADTAQSALSYTLPGHLLLRTPFVGLHNDHSDYVAEAIRKYHGMPACKALCFVAQSRYTAAYKPDGARKKLAWQGRPVRKQQNGLMGWAAAYNVAHITACKTA